MRKFFYDTEFIEYPRTIHPISIGIVSEDGEEFYSINSTIPIDKASPWVKENVLNRLPDPEAYPELYLPEAILRNEIIRFLNVSKSDPVQLWGYYPSYDHVNFCWLFGPMIDLPKGVSMYTMDLKQLANHLGNPDLPKVREGHDALEDARWNRQTYLFLKNYAEKKGFKLVI